jgi:hypothetical protein
VMKSSKLKPTELKNKNKKMAKEVNLLRHFYSMIRLMLLQAHKKVRFGE